MSMKRSLVLSVILVILLAACTGATPTINPTPAGSDLAKTSWSLTSYGSESSPTAVVTGSKTTLQFQANGQVSGSGGCNSFGGIYQIQGEKITFQDVASTLMACADTAIMDQESAFFHALNTATRYQLSNDTLKIDYDGGVLNFTKAG